MAHKDAHDATRQNTSVADRLSGSAMARRESAHSARLDSRHPEWCLPFGRGMAKQHRSAVPAAAMHLAGTHWQVKSRAMQRAQSQVNCRAKVERLLQQPAKPQLLEQQD